MDLPHLLSGVRAAVAEAGQRIRTDFAAPSGIRHKGRIDLVTSTDLAVERLLAERLGGLLPGSTVLGEETTGKAALDGPTWIVDPIDGTTNFVHGFPFVCSSVALYAGGEVVLGVVNAPILGECFSAGRGLGAFCNDSPLAVSSVADPEAALVATGFPYTVRENMRLCGNICCSDSPALAGRYGFYTAAASSRTTPARYWGLTMWTECW